MNICALTAPCVLNDCDLLPNGTKPSPGQTMTYCHLDPWERRLYFNQNTKLSVNENVFVVFKMVAVLFSVHVLPWSCEIKPYTSPLILSLQIEPSMPKLRHKSISSSWNFHNHCHLDYYHVEHAVHWDNFWRSRIRFCDFSVRQSVMGHIEPMHFQ